MASTISFSGLSASGLDTSSWVDALVSVKQQTITSLEQQKAEKENLLSIVNNIKSYFSSFQTCLQKITDSQYGIASMDLFMQNLALSSNSSIATATATTEAARQSYDVAVDSLATATKATSGYSQFEVKTADLNTTFGTLGGKNGTITVNSQSFNVTTEDTLQNLIDKFKNVGVDAKFDESKGTFTIGMDLNKIDEGATNLKNALKLANNNVSGAVSGSVVYANRNTEFYKLGLNGGDINIEGVKHTITKNGNNYTIQKDGGAAVQMNTLGEFLDYLKSSAVGADDATVDTKGHITIKGATLDKVEGGTNLIDVLNLIESQKRTVSESGALSYIEVRVADLNTKLSALGITGDTTLVAGGVNNTISNDKTLGDIKNILKNAGVYMSVDSRGIITIDTHGNEISGTLLDVLNLDPTKGGTTISSSAHQATLKADGNTKLSELGITTDKKYIAYKSDGTALTTEISNVEGKTVNEFVNALKNSGLDAKFDEKTHQITIKDGYIEGSLADALGMTQLSTSFTENASLNTQLEKLGATGDSTLTIDGGAAKTYDKNTTLETVFNDIKNAGGKVTFKDGNVTIEGVTLGGSLPSLLGLDATTQGTSVTSGKLTAVTGSTSSGGNTESTVEHNIELSTKLGDITGTTSNYTLKVGDGTSTTYTKDSTLQDIKTQIEGAGGKFTINDDNTISIEGVTMSGTVVGALGFDELATGTKFTTVNAVMISGTSNIATGDTTLGNLGLISGSTSGARAVRRAPANPNKTLSINGGTAKTYGADSSLDDIFADIVAAGGTASINSEGYIVINGVHLEGTLVDALGLVETSYKTTITSGDLKVTTSTKSTSSSTLYTDTKGDIAWDSTIGSIVGDTNSYDLKVNGTNKTYNTNTKLSDIKNVIQAAGGTMTINDDNTISINGVEISGSLVDKLGFNSDGVHTVVSSNNPIYYTDGKKSADTGTTFEQLGIGADKRDYAIYKNDGTVVKASSTNGTSSGKTIGDWLRVVNDSLNTANGTRDITYASINNGVISITGGYVTGSLPTELGIGIKETVTGITMEGSSVSYVEYEPLKYIGNIQTGSGIAGGTMVSSGFMAESIKYQDELGNIHAVTETTKLSEVLDTSGNKIGSGSYTFNVGSYTKTFDADSTTLGDIVNYVNNLNMDTTHDTTTSATLVDGKLTIESNVSITGTLLDKLGFEKQDVSTVAYEIKGTNKAHYSKSEGVTVTASGFSTAVTTQSTSGTDKVYVSSLSDFVSGSTYYIKSADDLNKLAELTNAGKNTSGVKFVLENDVDLAGQQFVPIGTFNNPFKGNFYGNGHVIKNLTITDTSVLSEPFTSGSSKVYHAGLFGMTNGAKLYDIGLENVNINLSIDGVEDGVWAGALVGYEQYSEINNCYSTGSVSADAYAGGLVGVVVLDSSVSNSYSTVNVSGKSIVGGLVANLGGKISNSFATGNVNGSSAGGLVGYVSSSTISNSFATGNVSASEGSKQNGAGGLVGYAFSGNITISDSFAMGNVTGTASQGGVVGIDSATTTVTNCGYSGSTGLDSGVSSGATAMTDAQLKSSIEGLGISSATVVSKTVDTTAELTTTIKDLMGKSGTQTLTLTPTAGGSAVTLTFNDTDTIQTVIDKLKAQGIDEADLTDGIFRIKDDKQWTLNGSSELVNKLFGGDDRTYSAEGPQVTYQVTQSSVGGYTGNKITYTTTTTGTVGSVTGNKLTYTTTTGSVGSVTGNKLTYTVSTADGSIVSNEMLYKKLANNSMSISGNKVTYTTGTGTVGSSGGTTTTKTYTGTKVTYGGKVATAYASNTKLADINVSLIGKRIAIINKEEFEQGKYGDSSSGSGSTSFDKPLDITLLGQVASMKITNSTTIDDVVSFLNSESLYVENASYNSNSGELTVKLANGNSVDMPFIADSSNSDWGGTAKFQVPKSPAVEGTTVTDATTLKELRLLIPNTNNKITVTNNGKTASFTVDDTTCIGDIIDNLEARAGCTATITDGVLTVTGGEDLAFGGNTTVLKKIFGGSIPTPTTSGGSGSTGGSSTQTATGTTKMSELGITDFTINGDALSGINADSTVVDVFTALKNEYGIEASISNGIVTFSATSDNYLEGEIINKFFGSKAVEFSTGLIKSNKVQYSTTETTSSDVYTQYDILPDETNNTKIFDLYVQSQAAPSCKKISSGSITVGSVTFTIDSSTTVADLKRFLKREDCTLDPIDGFGGSLYNIVSNNGASVSVSGDIANDVGGAPTIGYLLTKSTTSSGETVNHNIDNNTTIGQIFGDTVSHTIKVGDETVTLQSTDKLSTLVSKLADKGVTAEIKNSALYLTTTNSTVFSGDIISRFFGQNKVIAGGSTYKYVDIELSTKFSDMEYDSTPVFEVDGTQIDGLTKDSTIQDLFNKLASKGINASLSNGKITLTSDTEHTLTGSAVEDFFGGAVTVGSSGDATSKTYSGSVLKTVSKGYTTDTKLVDIDSSYKGTKMYVYKENSSTSGTGTTPVRPGTSGTSGKPGNSVDMNENNLKPLYDVVATLSIDENTTIQDVIDFYNPYLDNKIDNVFKPLNKYSLEDGTITLAFKSGYRNKYFGGSDEATLSFGTTTPTVATTSTKLYELETSPAIISSIKVTNNGNKYSFDAGSHGTDSPTIQDVLDFLNNTAGCTATFTDGKLTVTGASDLEFEEPTTTGKIYDMSVLFGGSMPTPTTSTTGSTGGTTTTHTATGSTKMSELGITDFTVNGSALSGITSSSTVNDVLSKLKSTYGLSEATISDGKITLSSTTSTTLSGNLIKGLMGQDSVTITPTSGTTTTTKTYTGTKVTYGATPATGYTTDTKLSTIKSRWVGKRIYVKSSEYTGSTTGYPGNSILFQYMDITNTTTIDDVIKFFDKSAGVMKATYDQTSGELKLRLNVDYSVSAPFIQCVGDDQLIGQLATKVYSFGKTGGSSGSPMTTSTTLNDLFVGTAGENTITVTNNGTTTSFDVSQSTNLLGIISNLQSVGCTATITDGVLTVTGGEDLAFGGNTTVWKSIFGGSIPTPTTSTTGSTGGGSTGGTSTVTATGSTKMSELGITDFTVNDSVLSGITSSSTVNDVLAKLKLTYGLSEATISDGKITLKSTTDTTLSGNLIKGLMGQDSVSITASSVTTPASKTGNKVTYTKSTTTNTGYKYTAADYNSSSVYHGMMKDFRLVSFIDTNTTYNSPQGQMLTGRTITGVDKDGLSFSIVIDDSTTLELFDNQLYGLGFRLTQVDAGMWGISKIDRHSGSIDIGDLAYQGSYNAAEYVAVIGKVVVEESGVPYTSTTKYTADSSTKMSDLGLSPTLKVDGKDITGLSSSSTVGEVLSALKSQYGIDGSISDGKMTLTSSSSHTVSGDVINKFFGSDSISLTPTTSGGGGSTTTHTATGTTKMSELGVTDFTVNGSALSGITSSSTIDDVLAKLKSTYGLSEATISDGKVTFKSNTNTTLSGNLINRLTGQDSVTISPDTSTTTQTADTTTKLGASGLGLTSFDLTIEPQGDSTPISISGLNGDSTIGDVFKKLAEKGITASMNNGVITLTSNTPCDLTGTIAKKLFGNDIVSLECADEIHDFTMTQVSGTKYQYVSRDLTSYSGAERVSEVSELVAGNKYHISSAEDLVALANFVKNGADTTGSIFMFDNDIDMSGVTGFEGIGTNTNAFKGTVYGNGHVVKNLTINTSSSYQGLFGNINQATIKDLGVVDANVTGGDYTGILVGQAENSQISNVYTSGTVTSNDAFVGGLVGDLTDSTATNVYSTADVKGSAAVGGLIGFSDGSIVEKAFATGKVTATDGQVGGLIGAMSNGGTVKNSYATGDVNGKVDVGGFVGVISVGSITTTFDTVYSTSRVSGSQYVGGFIGFVDTDVTTNIKNAVYNRSTGVDAIGNGSATGILGKDYEQMIQKSIMQNAGFTEDKGWVYTANSTPTFGNTTVTGGGKTYLDSSITSLSSGSTYYISTLEQLNNLATLVNNGADTSGVNFVLDNDIDVSSFTNTIDCFKGTFYGNGHSLTGLKTALFDEVIGNAIVRDLALENMSGAGHLANTVTDNSTVDNVYSTGSTISSSGLIETLEGNATLKNSYSTVNLTVNAAYAGGLVSRMSDNATIEHCFAKNTIEQKFTSMAMGAIAGGLVGIVSGGTIKSSYADCNINVVKYSIHNTVAGGLIGGVSGDVTIENCYATGSRTADKTGMFIGQNNGRVTSSGNVACTGSSISGTPSGFSDGVTFVSNAELNSQARMEALGFTKDKGWVYYTGKAPMLQGKDTSSAGTTFQMSDTTTLDSICQNRENKTLSVTINGETHSKTFKGSDTVGDIANWLNGIDGVTANISNNKFNISGTSQDFRVDGELADVLFGNNKTTTKQTITENTDSNGLIVGGGQKKIDDNTTVGQLLGVTSGKYVITYIDDSGNLQSGKFSSDEKLSEVLKFLNDNGFQASIVNGVFTATKDGKIATNISGTIGEKLKGENGTVTNTSSGYKTGQLDASSSTKATATTKLADLGIASGSIFIKDNNNNTLGTIQIDNSMTIDDTAQLLANYGFTLGITDGKVTIEGNGTNRIADGTSNLVSQMKLNNWIETKDKLKTDSTVAQMGFGKGSTLGLVLDKKTYNLTFDANATLQDIIDTLGTYGVTASVDSDGKFTATASGNLVLTNELGAYLTKNSAEGYVKEADGYKSKDPLEFKGDKVKLDYDSKVGDILGTGKDGVLRLTLNKDTVVDLTYKADDTMADIIADLKGYGITATIDDGVLKATSNEKTFRFSGEIGKIISGDTPQYDDISTGYVSKDLSYETTNKTNMNNTLKEMGVSSGQIHVLSNDGKIVSTLDIDNSYTVAQVKSLLQPFGMTLSVDENGKFTVASAEGYKLSDSTSNMVSKMGLNNWTTATEKLSGATTLAQMGFKDGADLNLFLDGIVMNVLSFDANQTVDDIIFGLAAYGIDASVNADGQFTATSKSHTFIMSGGLGSYLTKGTGGYVNSDTAYESYKPLVESKDYVETASKGLDYNKLMTETSTLESLGFAQGGTVRVMLDGKTPYTLQFLATDKVQDVIYALSAYGINAEVKDGRFVAESVNNTFTLTGNLGSYLVQGGAYQNEITGYESNPLTYETTEKLTNDTKLSDLGITRGDINVIKDGKVTDTIHISDNTTIGQLFSAIKPYGMTGEIVTKANGDTSIRISADSDIKLADGTSNVVSGLGLQEVRKGDFEGIKKYWDDDATSGLITEDTLLSTLDRNGFIAQGSLIFNTGEGDDAVQHIINISANETVGSLLKKFNDSGIKATLDDGVIKLTGGLDKLEFTGGTSGLVETIGLDIHNIDKYASSSSALTYEGETHYSASNFANANTKLDIVNATDGNMSIFVDGIKCNIEVKSSDSFADLFKKIKDKVKARTGLDIQAGFKTKDGSISANPTDADNTGIIGLEIEKGHELVVGASNDTTNFATIANLNKTDYNAVTGSRALYRVNVNSLITESGLYRDGDITEGTFKIGDAEFTIDSTTTLASLINQINKNDKAYANAYWDTLAGTLVIESTVTGASLINIEAGTSNFTDIMGFTKTKDGVSALVTDSQTLGQNAVVRINGTTVTSATNVITSDISKIKGLTINLKNVSAGETVTISVEQDKEAIYSAVSDTLDAYNSMMEALGKELADKNSLGGESILKLMRNNLKRLMTSSLTGAYVFKNLASVGISTGEASDKISTNVTSLLIDKDKFMDALNTDSDAVQDLLVGTKANPGIFLQANNIVESSINTEGYFSNMANTLSKSISNIEKKISKNNLAIENYRTKLETKFHNMELTISGLQSAYANILK